MIFPIIMLALTVVGGSIFLFITKINDKKNKETSKDLETAQEFINVMDIKGNFLYTRDKYIFGFIKVNPISIELLSNKEKRILAKKLTAELSAVQNKFRFLAVSRPIDVKPLIDNYSSLLFDTDNPKQKELLRHEMLSLSNYAMSGENVERQYYIRLHEKYEEGIERELLSRLVDLVERFNNHQVRCEILKEQDIIRLCNLINNPAYSHIEDANFEAAIPFMFMEGV